MTNYKAYFGFTAEPFAQDIPADKLFPTPALRSTTERSLFAIHLGAVCVITGEVGAGKSTTLRYLASKLHPSSYRLIPVIASTGSTLEVLRQISNALDSDSRSNSIAKITKSIRTLIMEISQRKQTPVLIIDEANLLRLELLAELQTLGQFDHDSKPLLPTILAGQSNLLDKLMYHTSRPLASRVVARSHLEGLSQTDLLGYLKHHLEIAGIKNQLFADEAILAIHQGSGGLLRRANNLARGALIAATREKCRVVSAEHVRVASTEII
jgi:general secretion pathway protein A